MADNGTERDPTQYDPGGKLLRKSILIGGALCVVL